MKRMKMGTAAGLLAAVLFIPRPASALSARRAILVDTVGNQVLLERRADEKSLIASTTKIMTGLLIAKNCNVLEPVKIPAEAVGVEGSSLYLKEGEVLTVQELLYGLLLRSGNDAAVALAIHCAGSQEAFAEMMNGKAAELGMTGSHFENPHGLDGENHYSTARDLSILGTAAMSDPIFAKTASTKTVRMGSRQLKNHNRLLWRVEGADGIKTGYTKAAGRILVSSAIRGGRRLVAVTIDDPDDWQDHEAMLESGFSRLQMRKLLEKGQTVGRLPVVGGEQSEVPIRAEADFFLLSQPEDRADVILPGPGFLYPPAVEGADLGQAWVLVKGTIVGRIPVSCAGTSELIEEEPKGFLKRIFGGKP